MTESRKVKLTDARASRLPAPLTGSVVYTDTAGQLTLYVSPTARVWRYRFRFAGGNPESIRLGSFPQMSASEARTKVNRYESVRADGIHPRTLRLSPPKEATVAEVLDHHLSHLTETTRRNVQSLYRDVRAAFGRKPVTSFTRSGFSKWITEHYECRPGAARSLIRNLTAAFNRAIDSMSGLTIPAGYEHPTRRTSQHIHWLKKRPLGSLAVTWEDHEWQRIMAAIRSGYACRRTNPAGLLALELLIETGARPSELCTARWDEIVTIGDHQTQATVLVKNKHKTIARTQQPRSIILTQRALDVIRRAEAHRVTVGYTGPYIFPSNQQKGKRTRGHIGPLTALAHRLGKAAGIDFKPYNFRSAYINIAAQTLGDNQMAVISANAGHSDSATTRQFYQRQLVSDRQTAAERVALSLARIEGPTAKYIDHNEVDLSHCANENRPDQTSKPSMDIDVHQQ